MPYFTSPSKMPILDSFDLKQRLLSLHEGKHYKTLPTPSLVVNEPIINNNISNLLHSIQNMNKKLKRPLKYRAHIKTHKTIEGSLKQLGHNLPKYAFTKYDSIVVSTLKEAEFIIDYQNSKNIEIVTDIAYGLPACVPNIIPDLYNLSRKVKKFRVFIDNIQHIDYLEEFRHGLNGEKFKWSVFVKIDCGTHRAGVFLEEELVTLLRKLLLAKDSIELYGFYCHAGHSYSKSSLKENEDLLLEEIRFVNDACSSLLKVDSTYPVSELVLSVGASPTVRSFQKAESQELINYIDNLHGTLELHAGNLMVSDLQQVATGTTERNDLAAFVLGTVISQYPRRGNDVGELLTNTGVLSMSKEVSEKFSGYGLLKENNKYGRWYLQRLSQEHGILQPLDETCELIPLGTKIEILMQHVCITMACFGYYFVIDDMGIIVDIWVPCKGW